MKIKNMAKITMATTIAFGSMVPAVNATEGDIINQAIETASRADTTMVNLHKLMYTDGEITPVLNTGKEMTIEGTTKYDPAKYGKVGFTAYKLDASQIQSLISEADASDTTEDTLIAERAKAQSIADEVEAAVIGNTELPYGATLLSEETMVDEEGIAKIAIPRKDPVVIVETTLPASVNQKAKPIFYWGPIKGLEEEVSLYPKNKIKPIELMIQKNQHLNVETAKKELDGATFELYKYTDAVGTGEKVESTVEAMTTKTIDGINGVFKLEDIPVGKYYIVETQTGLDSVNGENEINSRLILNPDVVNKNTNKLLFNVTDGGVLEFPEGSLLAQEIADQNVVNYEKPDIDKQLTDRLNETEEETITPESPKKYSYNVGDLFEYTINVMIPHDVDKYEGFKITDIADDVLKQDITTVEIPGLTKDTDYKVTALTDNNGYEITFEGTEGLKVLEQYKGEKMPITYKASITTNENVAGKELVNNVTLDWNNGVIVEQELDDERVYTFEKQFTKRGKGVFSTKIMSEVLKDAEFVVKNADGKYLKQEVVSEELKTTWEDSLETATKFISGDDGTFKVSGLAVGTYFLEETMAPEGYKLLEEPVEFKIEEHEENAATNQDVINESEAALPMTGAIEILIVGTVVFGGIAVAIKSRKKNELE